MARPARLYAQIDLNYFEDDRVLAIDDAWPLHFVAILAGKRGTGDGYLTERQLRRAAAGAGIVGDFDAYYAACVREGLFLEERNGVRIRSWERWNDTQADIERKSRDAVYANHCRHHVGKGKKPSATCQYCTASDAESGSDPERIQDGVDSESIPDPGRSPREDIDAEIDADLGAR